MKKYWLLGLFLYATHTLACTHFLLTAKDHSAIIGRSMEFGSNLETDIYSVNRNTQFKSVTPDRKPGLSWQAKYGYLALDGFHLFPVSGLNEKGLSFDALYFPGVAKYEPYDTEHSEQSMPYYQIADYILGNFKEVDEIKLALPKINIYAKELQHQGQAVIFPLHFIVTDNSSKSLVIELVGGKLHLYDSPSGVFTNSPSYPWQVTNLQNYVNLSPNTPEPIIADGITYNATGQGGGAIGLPGDYTPPSRFVKTSYLVITAKQMPDAAHTVNLATHILNNVDIPYGAVRGPKGKISSDSVDLTQWAIVKDLSHLILYFRTYTDLNLQKIDMKALNFEPDSPPFRKSLMVNDKIFFGTSSDAEMPLGSS